MSEVPKESNSAADLRVPMQDVVRFVRQLSHDLRNHLNAAELQSAYLKEVAEDGEVKSEVQRLRGMLTEMSNSLQRLTVALATVKLTEMPYEAAAFVEDLQEKIKKQFPEQHGEIEWDVNVGHGLLTIDPQILQEAFLELFGNAWQHGRGGGRLAASAKADEKEFAFELREPKADFKDSVAEWGREPFRKVGQGHYGLGLHRVRTIIEAHRGHLIARYDSSSSSLITAITLPVGAARD